MDIQEEMHCDLLPGSVIALAAAGLLMALVDPVKAPPPSPTALGLLMVGLAAVVWQLLGRSKAAAIWAINLGVLLLIVLASRWMPSWQAHRALVLPVIAAGMIQSARACVIVTMFASLGLAAGAPSPGFSSTTLSGLVGSATVLWLAALLVCTWQRVQRGMVEEAWERYGQARGNLEDAREERLKLKQALEDLALANSEMVRLNNLLSAAREAVEEARRAKQEFVANVSHELRTPLNMIIGFSDEILERPQVYASQLPPDLLEDVAAIRRNSEHLARLVDDVLDLSETDMGHAKLLWERTSVREVAEEAVEAVALLFRKKGLALVVDMPGDLPSVDCDRARIRQVIINLLSNAGRFTETGGATIGAALQNGMVVVRVTDTGSGVDRKAIDRLFEPFQQADSSIRRRHGGTGLGLTISKRFIEMHGGKIWLESEPGRGTTVSFSLPIDRLSPEGGARRWFSPYQEYTTRPRRSLAPGTEPKSGLVIVEEGNALSDLAERYLEELEPISVRTVEEAGQAMESGAAAAVLINAPAQSPEARAFASLPARAFDVPIMSCWIPQRRMWVGEKNVQDYLVKPILRSHLLDSIAKVAPGARSILVVDDDPEALQLFERMLTNLNRDYRIICAGDGTSALALMRTRQPDLVLLDIVMPNKDGFAVLEAMAADPAIEQIPVIIVSAKDPKREPIVSEALVVTRQRGLSPRDLMLAVEALTCALPPRFGVPAQLETAVPSPVSG